MNSLNDGLSAFPKTLNDGLSASPKTLPSEEFALQGEMRKKRKSVALSTRVTTTTMVIVTPTRLATSPLCLLRGARNGQHGLCAFWQHSTLFLSIVWRCVIHSKRMPSSGKSFQGLKSRRRHFFGRGRNDNEDGDDNDEEEEVRRLLYSCWMKSTTS